MLFKIHPDHSRFRWNFHNVNGMKALLSFARRIARKLCALKSSFGPVCSLIVYCPVPFVSTSAQSYCEESFLLCTKFFLYFSGGDLFPGKTFMNFRSGPDLLAVKASCRCRCKEIQAIGLFQCLGKWILSFFFVFLFFYKWINLIPLLSSPLLVN